ncbi:hypothetical protein PLICRDRAFT_170440 [Plicaturopsis crispa FD-325 SS-3]|nr:hypothetical protein PLICRDRAFT_170440 [Plicaturopsis crispa FD-325 SS-3]
MARTSETRSRRVALAAPPCRWCSIPLSPVSRPNLLVSTFGQDGHVYVDRNPASGRVALAPPPAVGVSAIPRPQCSQSAQDDEDYTDRLPASECVVLAAPPSRCPSRRLSNSTHGPHQADSSPRRCPVLSRAACLLVSLELAEQLYACTIQRRASLLPADSSSPSQRHYTMRPFGISA